jgi:hypothetical protein
MTNLLRNPDIAIRINPTYNYIEHPNIKLDRIKTYSNYSKRYSTPIFIGIPNKSASISCKCREAPQKAQNETPCDCHQPVIVEKATGTMISGEFCNVFRWFYF